MMAAKQNEVSEVEREWRMQQSVLGSILTQTHRPPNTYTQTHTLKLMEDEKSQRYYDIVF